MERDFWIERWARGQTGFHQDRINGYLTRHWARMNAGEGSRVLVPLCGKSKDMLWLAEQGHEVLGVELSQVAVDAFFSENDLPCERSHHGSFDVSKGASISLWCGDFFDLARDDMEGVTCVYDRASLVALPPEMRRRYAQHLVELLPKDARVLLVTFEYPQHEMQGPPFSVASAEVDELYQGAFDLEQLEEVDMLAESRSLRARGLSRLAEKSYLMTKRRGQMAKP